MSVKSTRGDGGETTAEITLSRRLVAEGLGTFVLVFGGVGTAMFGVATGVTPFIALAFGLTVVGGAYAFGPVSGGHFNPAVTLGLAMGGRFPWRNVLAYIGAQLIGGIVGALGVFAILKSAGKDVGTLASNGYSDAVVPGAFGLWPAAITEVIVTAVFVFVIIGATSKIANSGMAGLAIGLTLALMLMVAIPVDNGSLNPARSIATAIFGGGDAIKQVWVFIVFPIIGGLIAGATHKVINKQ